MLEVVVAPPLLKIRKAKEGLAEVNLQSGKKYDPTQPAAPRDKRWAEEAISIQMQVTIADEVTKKMQKKWDVAGVAGG
jgi:hypothetical protein